MATANDLLRALNPSATQKVNQPFGNPATSVAPTNVGQQLNDQVDQSQQQFGADFNANRNNLMSQIKAASIGGNVGLGSQSNATTNPLAPVVNSVANSTQTQNDTVNQITQRGQYATDAVNAANSFNWNQKLQKLGLSYQTNLANAQSQPYTTNQDGSFTQSLPPGTDLNNAGGRAVALAQAVVKANVPYVWGGNSLTQGVDCSGLVQQVYGKLGIQLPRTSTEQAKYGKVVPSLSQALPGDLILEYSPYEPAGLQQYGHVAIYIGNGRVIEAPGTGKNVRVGPIVNMTKIVRPW